MRHRADTDRSSPLSRANDWIDSTTPGAWIERQHRVVRTLVWMVIGAVIVTLLAVVGARATSAPAAPTSSTTQSRVCQPNPPPDLVCSPDQFMTYFKAGAYSRTVSMFYSKAMHAAFMYKVKQHKASHPKWEPCPGSSNLGCVWTRYVNHDSCAVSSLPDTFDADSCRASKGLRGLLSSPYWTRRGQLYNKWSLRVVFCGTLGIISIASDGMLAKIMGSGAGACLANRLVK